MTSRGRSDAGYRSDEITGLRHEVLEPEPGCRYLERWVVNVGRPRRPRWFSLRLHHFYRSDEDHLHDHPFWFWTLVLWGFYEDVVECRCVAPGAVRDGGPWLNCPRCGGTGQVVGDRMTPGTLRYRPALHRHRVVTDGVWTLVLTGPKVRDWGFWVDGAWMRQRAYFRRFGGGAACQ